MNSKWATVLAANGLGMLFADIAFLAVAHQIGTFTSVGSAIVVSTLFVIPPSYYIWIKNEARTGWEWIGLSFISMVMAFFFAWIDCRHEDLLKVLLATCRSRYFGFSSVFNLVALGYTCTCIGGAIRAWILGRNKESG